MNRCKRSIYAVYSGLSFKMKDSIFTPSLCFFFEWSVCKIHFMKCARDFFTGLAASQLLFKDTFNAN